MQMLRRQVLVMDFGRTCLHKTVNSRHREQVQAYFMVDVQLNSLHRSAGISKAEMDTNSISNEAYNSWWKLLK
jgi:hypothetical protein